MNRELIITHLKWQSITISLVILLIFSTVIAPMIWVEEYEEKDRIYEERVDRRAIQFDISRNSIDCTELIQVQLDLLSIGADADKWLDYSQDDKNLKFAKERYNLLCLGVGK